MPTDTLFYIFWTLSNFSLIFIVFSLFLFLSHSTSSLFLPQVGELRLQSLSIPVVLPSITGPMVCSLLLPEPVLRALHSFP